MLYSLLRPFLFCLPAEFTHHFSLKLLSWLYTASRVKRIRKKLPQKPVQLFNLSFSNPIGLAAGLDKNADYLDALFGLGFGFIEVGAVTPRAQLGNAKPRLFRLPKANALINRLGFNNLGVDHLVQQLKKRSVPGIVGVNIGKNHDTPLDKAVEDYAFCFRKIYPYADFATINISSPNTLGLRELQGETYLLNLLITMKNLQQKLRAQHKRHVPLLVKIAPDLSEPEIDIIVKVVLQTTMDGIIAANTTLARSAVEGLAHAKEPGGLSGQPLFANTLKMIQYLQQQTAGNLPLIAVGGISSASEASALLAAGASLVQLYTGLIYQGPGLVSKIIREL